MRISRSEFPSHDSRPTRVDVFWKASILIGVIAPVLLCVRSGVPLSVFVFLRAETSTSVACICVGSGVIAFLYTLVSLYHALRYRPVPAQSREEDLPTVTVVVPAFNEGPMVRVALASALASDYPKGKLHVVAVDDGSTDDTWEHMAKVASAFPDRVTAIRQRKNGGKREALCAGFLRARGEVVITVDSDSKLDPEAIRNAVAPIMADPEVSAVAGKVLVLNRYESLLTRLLAARFFLTFDFSRAVQSRFGAVLCCPGALTAYRREAVMRVLPKWAAQTFLGTPCTIGEDRALTTWLLRDGGRAVYQSTSIVHTIVPSTLGATARMLVRWERGNVRESLVLLPILTTKWRTRDRLWPTLEVIVDLLQFPFSCFLAILVMGRITSHPLEILGLVASMGVVAFAQSLYCLRSEKGTDFLYNVGYAFLAAFGLQWIFPYSCLTLRNGAWLTR